MRVFFTLLGEFVEALIKHYQQDEEFAQLVTDIADYILTALGAPDVIPGDPFARTASAQAGDQSSAQAMQGGLVDFSTGA
jgi:hypothetical protein